MPVSGQLSVRVELRRVAPRRGQEIVPAAPDGLCRTERSRQYDWCGVPEMAVPNNCLAPPCKVPINRDKRATDTPSQIFSDYFSAFSRIPSQIEMVDPSRAAQSPSPHIRQKSDRKKKKQKGSEEDRDEEGGARVVRRG